MIKKLKYIKLILKICTPAYISYLMFLQPD